MPRALKAKATKKAHKAARAGKRKEKGDHKIEKTTSRHKRIKKIQPKKRNKDKQTKIKEQQKIQKLQNSIKKSEYLDAGVKSHIENLIKKEVGIKVVLLVPFNNSANVKLLQSQIQGYIKQKTGNMQEVQLKSGTEFKFPYFHFYAHPKQFPGLVKQNFLFISVDRNIQNMLDYAKVADVIVPVLSCKQANLEGMSLNPHDNANAFDVLGYEQLYALRQQGMLNSVCVLQDLHQFSQKQDKVLKLFQRFFQSQFDSGDKMIATNNYDDIFTLLRRLQNIPETKLPWRDMRGYMLVDKISYDNEKGLTFVEGFLKGNAVHANQLIHITGMDDYEIQRIEILKSKSKLQRVKQTKKTNQMEQQLNTNIELVQFSTPTDQIKPLKDVPADGEDLIDAFQGLTLSKPLMQEEEQMQLQDDIEEQESDISFEDVQQGNTQKDDQKKKRVVMETRDQGDLQFQDEVQYPVQSLVRELYRGYQGLSSFRNTQVNKLQNLPREYNSIFAFRNYQHTLKSAVKQAKQKAFAFPGFYIRVVIKGISISALQKHNKQTPMIVSFLLKHERKMTQVHLKVRRNISYPDQDIPVVSNKPYEIHLGFRKIVLKPIFSKILGGADKTKYREHFTDEQGYYLCSFYYYNTYTPAPAAIYRINEFTNNPESMPIMVGGLSKCDPMHVIMKRVILTGYPFKINRRRAVVRYMFFNPKDIKYFKPVQLKTKLGLRGNIEQSLGTHGLMKCLFNDMIKPHDTVCLYLYKRVFPQPWF